MIPAGCRRITTSAERDRDSLLAIVEDLLQIAADDRDPSELAGEAKRELVAHPVDDRGSAVTWQERVRVNPQPIRPVPLQVDEPMGWVPDFDPRQPLDGQAVELQRVPDQDALAHVDRAGRDHSKAEPWRGDALEREGIREELEGGLGRGRDPLLTLQNVNGH